MVTRKVLQVLILLGVFVTVASGTRADAAGFSLGLFDGRFTSSDTTLAASLLTQAQRLGSTEVRLMPNWNGIAPKAASAGFDATNPDDPAYSWTTLDADVRAASARGLRIMLTIFNAPIWAQGSDRPAKGDNINWKVDPVEVGKFARALARRYSGTHADPAQPGQTLPKISDWQVWNEPNLYTNLNPQWVRSSGAWEPDAATRYRAILNAAYAGVKSVDLRNRVVTAGTGPFGDPDPGGRRIMPLAFWRYALCLAPKRGCSSPPHFDVAAHHPYSVRGPTAHAANADDASVADVEKVSKLVREAVQAGTALPRASKPTWVTELSWDSSPPDPEGIPVARQAKWLSQSAYVLWKQGVSVLIWFTVGDSPPVPSYAATIQGGVQFLDGRDKPSAAAFRFPFVVRRQSGSKRTAWGVAPMAGRVVIEARQKGAWKQVASGTAPSGRVFDIPVPTGKAALRARQATTVSPSWP